MSNRYIIIMAGGRGERFWPKSRLARPKHLQPIVGETTMLAQTVERVSELVPAENLIIITNAEQRDIILEDLPQLSPDQVIGEPVGRDTAAAVGLATVLVQAKDPDASYAILPADHVIHDGESYRMVLERAFVAAEDTGALVTIGIKPTEPATGYGYIHFGEVLAEANGAPVYKVQQFVEKPDLPTAQDYLDSKEYFWNAGMFIWRASAIDAELKKQTPELCEGLQKIALGLASGQSAESVMEEVYPTLKKISIDFAVMENATNVAMVESAFDWDDVGAWPAIERHYPKDADGNVGKGTTIFSEASNNIVVSEGGHLTAVIGAEDFIIVHTKDATLVCHKDKAQEIKAVVNQLGKSDDFKHLV
ncbi:NTP transferase domain-containing protein [Opitutia bacterium ISCC 51]|nr:NTP transferase domain-containing protein [Opitutae bacterium ISCC 51]QXD28310.1 NTP transferase domain-containing protein [Opitutae bacterium ISCC 52]